MAIKTIFFDLGGVILNFSHEKMFQDIATYCDIDPTVVQKHIRIEGLGKLYERGSISNEEFFKHFTTLTPKKITIDGLMHSATQMFSVKQEMLPLLEKLKEKSVELILLSNTCDPHIEHVKTNYSFLKLFDHLVLSFEVKASKPEKAIYEKALSLTNSPLESCLYVDDVKEYIEAAQELEIPGHHFQGYKELVKALERVLE